jgi:hypothetical protein
LTQAEQHREHEASCDLRNGNVAHALRNEQHAKGNRHAKSGCVSQPAAPQHAPLHHWPVYDIVEQKQYSTRCTANCTIS